MKGISYPIFTVITFVIIPPIIKNALGLSGGDAFGLTVVVVVIAVTSDLIRRGIEQKKVDQKESSQIQADLDELRKGVAEIREYVTDLYIQQHDPDLRKKKADASF